MQQSRCPYRGGPVYIHVQVMMSYFKRGSTNVDSITSFQFCRIAMKKGTILVTPNPLEFPLVDRVIYDYPETLSKFVRVRAL